MSLLKWDVKVMHVVEAKIHLEQTGNSVVMFTFNGLNEVYFQGEA